MSISRFFAKVRRSDGCWTWLGTCNSKTGRAYFKVGCKNVIAARWIFEAMVSPIPRGMCVLHKCDNNKCVNPSHLRLGTQLDNIRDRDERRRGWQVNRSHCPKGHPYNESNTYLFGRGYRACRTCGRMSAAAYKARKLALSGVRP